MASLPHACEMNGNAFTLIELVVVILIVAILAAFAVPRFQDRGDDARAAVVMQNVRVVHNMADLFRADYGRLPADAGPGEFPQEFDGLLSPALFTTPLENGAQYDWNGSGSPLVPRGLSILFVNGEVSTATALYQDIEAQIDDGDPSAGFVRARNNRILFKFH
ncbi:MAG: prepilin-type N-terminal cleavage/methylation domain-containing protein [Planctomycetota bacterium]